MSHVVNIKIRVASLDALELAAQRCGLEMVRGQQTYRWYGRYMGDYPLPANTTRDELGHCDHALRVSQNQDAYEVGVCRQADGTFKLLFDFWASGHGLQAAIGPSGSKLTDEYALAVAELKAMEMGWMFERRGNELVIFHPGNQGAEIHVTKDTVDAVGFTGAGCLDPVTTIASAMGVETGSVLKPEFTYAESQVNQK